MNRTLIINGDDLGYTNGVNRAIMYCASRGTLRSASVMANGAAFDDAVAAVKRTGAPDVGVHLALTELKSLSPPREVSNLVDEQGLMPARPHVLMGLLLRGKITGRTIRMELSRQIEKVLDCGLTITHLDSHQHVHVLPEVLDVVVEMARKYSIRWIRNPFDATSGWKTLPLVRNGDKLVFVKQYARARLSGIYRAAFTSLVRRSGLRAPDHFHGVSLTGIWNEALVARLFENLPPGINEVMIHPGDCDEELRHRRTRLLEQRETERDLFSSTALRELAVKHNVTLAGYGEIGT